MKVQIESTNMALIQDLMVPEQQQLFSVHGSSAPSPVVVPGTPAISTDSEVPAPSTPASSVKDPKPKAGNKQPKKGAKVEAVTALEKGRDLEKQILAKKSECMTLMTQVRTLEFGAGLAKELEKFGGQFEPLGNLFVHSHVCLKTTCPPNQKSKESPSAGIKDGKPA